MSEGNGHVPENLPILLVGGARGRLTGGRHVKYREGHAAGELPPEPARSAGRPRSSSIGNSTGRVSLD